MKLGEVSELHLAAIIALATAFGGVLSTGAEWLFVDAGTEKQTDVQMVQLAIGILSEPSEASQPADRALRAWAVETINTVAEIKFDANAQSQLIDGTIEFPIYGSVEAVLRAKGIDPEDYLPSEQPPRDPPAQ